MAGAQFSIPALRVRQWLRTWDAVDFDDKGHRRKPEPHFYVTSMDAGLLKRLTGVQQRTLDGGTRENELGIQRRHDEKRSAEIAAYVRYGFPWSELPANRRTSNEFRDLKKPGWLPTALVVNILGANDRRGSNRVSPGDLVRIGPQIDGVEYFDLPIGARQPAWRPTSLPPLEIIDGQHRLWAFDETGLPDGYQLPVVAFHALDISWQAYLFYVINIKPTKINRSLAFDLYPLLRTEEWINKFEGAGIYRETRAQELTEILWSHPDSPWHGRINMVGDPGTRGVTQAAWIRSLLASFVKGWEGRGRRLGGLFGSAIGSDLLVLPWTRAQQGAFLILIWQRMAEEVARTGSHWAKATGHDLFAETSLLNTDQGVRGFLQVANDFFYLSARDLGLSAWADASPTSEVVDLDQVSAALSSASGEPLDRFAQRLCVSLANYDWRTAAAPDLSADQKLAKMAIRGSGGYTVLRRDILASVADSSDPELSNLASRVLATLQPAV